MLPLTFQEITGADLARVYQFRREIYTAEFGRDLSDEFDEKSHHLVGLTESGELAIAFRIIPPRARPFEIERFARIPVLEGPRREVAQVGTLAVAREYRVVRRGNVPQFDALKFAISFSRRSGYSDLVLWTFPSLVSFYGRVFFDRVCAVDHPAWGSLHVMHLSLDGLNARRVQAARLATLEFLLSPDPPNFIFTAEGR